MPADRQAHHQAQHLRLLEGLADSIREKGLAATQVGDIVRHAKASRRTFYNHFPDKDSCLVELAQSVSTQVRAEVTASLDPAATVAEQIDVAIDTYLQAVGEDLALSITFYSPGLSERVVTEQREAMERYAELLAGVVAARTGEPISLTRAFMLISGLAQAVGRAVDHGEDLDAVGAEIKDVLKRVVGAE